VRSEERCGYVPVGLKGGGEDEGEDESGAEV
jgi:hypothetical protein